MNDWLALTFEIAALALLVVTVAIALGYTSSHPNGHHPHDHHDADDAH